MPTFDKSKTKLNGVEGVKPLTKQYQREDPDSEDDEKTLLHDNVERSDQPIEVEGVKPLVKRPRGHPKGTKNKIKEVYVEPEKIVEMVQKNELKLTKAQQKALLPKRTRTINEKERQRLIEMGRKGRESMIANKAKRDQDKQEMKDAERKRQELINAKKIHVSRPEKKKRIPLKKVEPKESLVEDEEYESDSDSEGFSTDTRAIRKVSKKIKQINQVLQPIQQQPIQKSYKELSLLDKLNLRF